MRSEWGVPVLARRRIPITRTQTVEYTFSKCVHFNSVLEFSYMSVVTELTAISSLSCIIILSIFNHVLSFLYVSLLTTLPTIP